ncbi:hypothetical protein ACOMHN_065662 [Nucella lapillus]
MEQVKTRTPNSSATLETLPQNSKSKDLPHLCERREKQQHQRKCPNPIVHPDVAQAQTEESVSFRCNEDSRPMFSPIPVNFSSDGEDSPRGFSFKATPANKEKTSFPAIHVEKCEKNQPSYVTSCSPDEPPATHSPDSDMDIDSEGMSQGSTRGLNVPSPYLHRKADGRVVLVTHDSNRRELNSWSSSEGNLPEALRRSVSSPGGQGHLLDLRYRPDWQPQPTLRQSSDMALHELRREEQRGPRTPRRLPARLEPLPPTLSHSCRTRSANSLHQSP